MIKVSDTLLSIIRENAFLEFGIHHQLFNQSQLARYLQPFVAARTHKEPSVSAITMALSRLAPALTKNTPEPADYHLEKISITTGLCTATFMRSANAHRALNRLQTDMHKKGNFCSVSESMREITVIVEDRFESRLHALVEERPVYSQANLTSVEVQFGNAYTGTPGMLYMLLQRVALQNINLIEITSTYSGITMYFARSDARIVFDTLLNSLSVTKFNG
jgi:hypothetical protein